MRSLQPIYISRLKLRLGLSLGLCLGWSVASTAEPVPVIATLPVAAITTPASVPEHKVKAAYLLLFTRYVEWPANAFPTAEDPIILGVLGANPFGDELANTLRGQKSQGRLLEVRFVKTVEEAALCHVIYIARRQERDEADWLLALRDKPVLTIAESERGLERGAVLALTLEESSRGAKVLFTASLPAAKAAGLKLSSSLLASAKKVIRVPAEPNGRP